MSIYNQEFNKDDVVLRYIVVSLLANLKEKIYLYQQTDQDTLNQIGVPFYYSITGSERFLSDKFIYDAEDNGYAKGDYEVVPRGVLQLSGISIDSGSLVNKFIRSEFVHTINNRLKTFSLNTMYLPLIISFDVTVVCSNVLEMLKITEAVVSKFYKTNAFRVDLGMFRIDSNFQVPEDYSQEKLFEFSIDDKKEFNVTFPIEVNSFMPVFEDGISLGELKYLLDNYTGNTTGIGEFRNGGIRFGGVLSQINSSLQDIELAPDQNIWSNTRDSYKPTNERKVYDEDEIKPNSGDTESDQSKEFRNDDV